MELIAALIVWAYGIFEYRCVNTNSKALHAQDEDITLLKINMLRNDATHFNGKFNQKDVARQIFVRLFVPVARFFSDWIGMSDLTIRELHYISPTILIN